MGHSLFTPPSLPLLPLSSPLFPSLPLSSRLVFASLAPVLLPFTALQRVLDLLHSPSFSFSFYGVRPRPCIWVLSGAARPSVVCLPQAGRFVFPIFGFRFLSCSLIGSDCLSKK